MTKKCTFISNKDIYPSESLLKQAKSIIIDLIENKNVIEFYCGGYSIFNDMMARYIFKLKKIYPNIKSVYITPYIDEKTLTDVKDKKIYDEIIFPEIEKTPLKYRIRKRNDWIIENVDYVIAYIKYTFGGAYKAWIKAEKNRNLIKFWLSEQEERNST